MNKVDKCIEILNKGGIVIFPTDTAFGIGCRIDKVEAIQKLFKIRKRPISQATPVLVSSIDMAKEYFANIPKDVEEKLIKKYWPGALTIVLPVKENKVNDLVTGGSKSIGIRMPNNLNVLKIIEGVGVPILGPSANLHGEKTPYKIEELDISLVDQVDYVLDEKAGGLEASTVIDCSQKPWKILRNGAIDISI